MVNQLGSVFENQDIKAILLDELSALGDDKREIAGLSVFRDDHLTDDVGGKPALKR